jgi:YD repeat-containing protein
MNHSSRFPSTRAIRLVSFFLWVPLLVPCLPFHLTKASQQHTRSQGSFGVPGAGLPDLSRVRGLKSEPPIIGDMVPSYESAGAAAPPTSAVFDGPPPATAKDDNRLDASNPQDVATQGKSPNAIQAFNDVALTHPFFAQIDLIKNRGVTVGCTTNPPMYCPNDLVTREQMAAFIMRSLGEFSPPTPGSQRFLDVPPANIFYNFIDRLAALNISVGCGGSNYCPASAVTRGQMVTFLERAVGRGNPPTPATQRFVDVPTNHTFYAFVESFVQHGMSRGAMNVFMQNCDNGLDGQHFCPDKALTRAEMAALLVIEFGWMDGYTANARLDPVNRTGQSGEDLFSGNCNWSLPLLGLPGRAGLDLDLALSYNSLVWTKVDPAMIFNADNGFSPGFRLGFPGISGQYSNSQAGGNAYVMTTPSGSRVEFRQVGASTEYVSADSSYLKLDYQGGNNTLLMRTTDGTLMTYSPSSSPVNGSVSGDYRCTQIKDRNGNYITIAYDSFGNLSTITDTLSRTVTFNYDALKYLTSISQTWGQTTHYWATLSYDSLAIQTNFSNLSVCGPPNNGVIKVLTQVLFADGSHYNFDYTTWGQVWRIKQYAGDGHQLGYTSYDLPADATNAQSDCPRFATRTDYAENWNTVNTSFTFDRATGLGGQATLPDGTLYKEYAAVSGWQKGLTNQTEVWSPSVRKKWSTLAWTQDNTSLTYPLNPRVIETNVYDDSSNRRRTTISYSSLTLPPNNTVCNLPSDVKEYDSPGTTVLRKTHTDYDSSLLNQHIIGLPSARYLYDTDTQGATPVSKVTFGYDASGSLSSVAPVQHDSSYGTGFTTRGNTTSVTRWDVTTLGNQNPQSVTSTMTYNTAGDLLSTSDPLSHQVTISYADSFSDNINHNTLAYPTTVTDADSYSSTTQYDYDLGAAKVTTDPKGATLTRTFDGAGRVTRIDSNNGGYTRLVYASSMTEVDSYVLQSTGVEIYSAQFLDGAGRVTATRRVLPSSTGGYSGQKFVYDQMGRLYQ